MDHHQGAAARAEAEPGALTHPAVVQLRAVERWLLEGLSESARAQAHMEWEGFGAALLPLGILFSAVRIPGRLVAVLAGVDAPRDAPRALDVFLAEALHGGPVICDPHRGWRFYALVPVSVPQTWAQATEGGRQDLDTEVLGPGWSVGVPRVAAVGYPAHGLVASYWSVPMTSPGHLCEPLRVARLIGEAAHQLTGKDM
ncbi:hypothetical protein [Streptomyces sp. NPDC006997]|uniref:hypothetical protein n=1 Tax=Streptomyces sp. NPDC006997 TaxID=3155356 RepID=UPI0033C75845